MAMATKVKRAEVKVSDDQQAVITRLQSELEVEHKLNRKLRREKAAEVQKIREAEQVSQKRLAKKLLQEKQNELESLRESLRIRHEAEIIKAIRQKDLEIKRLQRDLLRCQNELKEEIAQQGLSTSGRRAFEIERSELLQKIKELTSAKKQLEHGLHVAAETEKQKTLEIRQLQESCQLEVAKIEKEAGTEVKKLLEELKCKDRLLEQMDHGRHHPVGSQDQHQYSVNHNQSVDELIDLSKELEENETEKQGATSPSIPMTVASGLQVIALQKKIYGLEKQIHVASGLNHAFIEKNKEITAIKNNLESKIKILTEENDELSCKLTSVDAEMKKMNEFLSGSKMESLCRQLERLRNQIQEKDLMIGQLRFDCWEKDRLMKLKARENQPKKAPGFDIDEVITDIHDGDDGFDDDSADTLSVGSSSSDTTIQSSQPSLSDVHLANDCRQLLDTSILLASVEKDYEQLMREHLVLEQSYASLLHSFSTQVEGEWTQEEWHIERESLNLAIYALEQKVRGCEENEKLLRIKLRQMTEEKEELEFKVLEHEECFERTGAGGTEGIQVLEKNQKLELELSCLQRKLEKYENAVKAPERNVGLQCSRPFEAEQPVVCREDLVKTTEPKDSLELFVKNLPDDFEENDSGNELALSTTASSGFDETCSEAEEPLLTRDQRRSSNPDVLQADERGSMHPPVINSTPKSNRNIERVKNDGNKENRVKEMETIIKNFESMEVTWKATVDRLERQLQLSFLHERIIRDQMTLVEEEKNRRISALQDQIDLLEDNELRLSSTILALENVALGVEEIQKEEEANDAADEELGKDVQEFDNKSKQMGDETEELVEAGRILGRVEGHIAGHVECQNSFELPDQTCQNSFELPDQTCQNSFELPDQTCQNSFELPDQTSAVETLMLTSEDEVVSLVNVVEKAVQRSIMQLEDVNHRLIEGSRKEQEMGQMIMKLETDAWTGTEDEGKSLSILHVRNTQVKYFHAVSDFSVGELQSELQHLRGLLVRLKTVIDSDEVDDKNGSSLRLLISSRSVDATSGLDFDLLTDGSKMADDDWPATASPDVKIASRFAEIDNDMTEFQIRKKVEELEKDCERLQKLVHEEEQTIRDIHFQNLELKNSEKNLKRVVERMETSEEEMHGQMEEMAEEMERLQALVKQLETKDRLARAQIIRYQESEAELEERLEQTVEELQNGKQRMERKVLELENEKKSLIRKVEEQFDRIWDLEGLSESLKLRIKNLEMSDCSLRSEMQKLEAELSLAAGELFELEEQNELSTQRLQDLEKEKSRLLSETADLAMDSSKQTLRIMFLNQEIEQLQESIINKDDVIACLQTKLEEADGMLNGLKMELLNYEILENEESRGLEANVNIQNSTEMKRQIHEVLTSRQSSQTNLEPLDVKIVVEKAALVLEENMKRFVSSLQFEIPCDSKAKMQGMVPVSNGHHQIMDRNGKEEETHWTKVEDLHVIYDVRDAENSVYWKEIEKRMGLNADDLALIAEFKANHLDQTVQGELSTSSHSVDGHDKIIPPPLPDSSPPPLSPETSRKDESAEESADEASEISEEDDRAIALDDTVASNWKVPYHGAPRHSDRSSTSSQQQQQLHRNSGISLHTEQVAPLTNRFVYAQSADRDCPNRNTFHGSELRRMATGSLDSVTDSGVDSLKQAASIFPDETYKLKKRNSFESEGCLKDQAIQTSGCELHEPIISLKTQLEQREKELVAKSNEMDRMSQEMRRWQQEAVAAGEEKARLSALLGCALKDLKVMQESGSGGSPEVKSPTIAAVLTKKSPLGFPGWGSSSGAEKKQPASHIPVRHNSMNDKDFAVKYQSNAGRPTSLYSEPSRSSSSSTDGAPYSDSGSSYVSPSQDRKTFSYLPHPTKDFGPSCFPSVSESSHQETDRLFRQSYDSTGNSQGSHSVSSPGQGGPQSLGNEMDSFHAIENVASRSDRAKIL